MQVDLEGLAVSNFRKSGAKYNQLSRALSELIALFHLLWWLLNYSIVCFEQISSWAPVSGSGRRAIKLLMQTYLLFHAKSLLIDRYPMQAGTTMTNYKNYFAELQEYIHKQRTWEN